MDREYDVEDASQGRQLPAKVRFSDMTPLGVIARPKKVRVVPSTGGEYNASKNTIDIILSSSTAFLDPQLSYLKFSVRNNTAATMYIDGSASSFIRRLRVVAQSSGVDLENLYEYQYLHSMLSDLKLSPEKRTSFHGICEGYGSVGSVNGLFSNFDFAAADALINRGTGIVTGQFAVNVLPQAAGSGETGIAAGQAHTFSVPLLSGIVGSLNPKYLPLFLTGDLLLQLEIGDGPVYMGADTPRNFSITDVEYHAQMVEFAGPINDTLKRLAISSGIFIHTNRFNFYPISLGSREGSTTAQINERLRSVKSLILGMRSNNVPDNTYRRVSGRVSRNLTSIQLKAGDFYYPALPIRGNAGNPALCAEFMAETMKGLGVFSSVNHAGIVNATNYCLNNTAAGYTLTGAATANANANAVSAKSIGRFVMAFDMDAFSRQAIESGLNLVSNSPLQILFEGIQLGGGTDNATYVDGYLLHDAIISINRNGTTTVSY